MRGLTAGKLLAPGLMLAGSTAAVHLWVASRFRRSIGSAFAQIEAGLDTRAARRDDLPAAVAACAGRAVPPSSSAPATFRIEQRGEIRLSPQGKWQAFTAQQVIAVAEPGFVWHALCRVAPLLTAEVIDSYVDGQGRLEARLMGSIPVARARGHIADRSELMRYLAEIPWAPPAILYNNFLRWRIVDDHTFEVSADSRGGEASVRLTLDEEGDIVGASADDRPRMEGNQSVPRRWFGVFSGHQELCGYRVPTAAEVSWDLENGPFTYWRGKIAAVEVSARR